MSASFFLALVLAATAPPAPDDGGVAWLCEREWKRPGISVTVARYLTSSGRQKEMYVEWQVGGSSGLMLDGFAGSDEAPRDVALDDWSLWVGWPSADEPLRSIEAQIVLGSPEDARLPAGLRPPIHLSSDLYTKWSALRGRAHRGMIEASLVDEQGHLVRSGAVAVAKVNLAQEQAKRQVALTRSDARNYRASCRPFDPRITVN